MPWLRIDDGMVEHLKVASLSDGAFRTHVEALSFAARNLTDGHIPSAVARKRGWGKRAGELVRAGLWEAVEGGHAIHDYLDYNPSREQVEAEREAARDRMSRHRAKRSRDVRPNSARTSGEVLDDVPVKFNDPDPDPDPDPRRDPDPDLSGDPRNHARAKGPRQEGGSASPAEPEPVRDAGVAAYLAAHDRMLSTWGPRDDEHRRRVVASSCALGGCLAEHVRTAERSLSDRDVWPQPPRQPWSAFAKALDHAMASCGLGALPDADDDDRLESLPLASEALIRDLRDRGELGESMAPPRLRRSI